MSCRQQNPSHASIGEDLGLVPEGVPEMERQGSRMQVDEDSRNARYQTDTFRMLGYKASPRSQDDNS